MKKLLLALLAISLFATKGWTASLDEEHELKQLCVNEAQELFNRETGKMKLDHINLSYKHHYNKSLKTCFMMIQLSTEVNPLDPPGNEVLSYDFFDVDEDTKIGSFLMQFDRKTGNKTLFYCHFSGKECHSQPEWNNIIKPYMEE